MKQSKYILLLFVSLATTAERTAAQTETPQLFPEPQRPVELAALATVTNAPAEKEADETESVITPDETPQPPANAPSAREVVRQFLSDCDITYRETPKGASRATFRYHLSPYEESLEVYPVDVAIDEANGMALCTATLPFTIPEEALPAVGELAAKWTKETPLGQFGVDVSAHGLFYQAKMPVKFLRVDDLPSFFSFFFVPSMYIAQKDAEVRAVAAGAGPRAVGGGVASKSDATNEEVEDNGNGVPTSDEGTSANNTSDTPPLIDESQVKDSISRWLDDMGVELFFKTESPGAATYRFDMRVTDDPGPFSIVQIMLHFSGAWVYADATPRVYFPKSRRRDILNAIARESTRVSYTSIYWLEDHRCYTARAVLPASAVVRDTDYALKWLLDHAGEAAKEIGGRFAQFLTEVGSPPEHSEPESP